MNKFIHDEFNSATAVDDGLSGRQRIFVSFDINEEGVIENIHIKTPHPILEKETRRVIEAIPKLQPGIHKNNAVSTTYKIPIVLKISD
ncbi:hypothetical protein GCM10022393_09440 [Aquimarina addita]|uniref:TonB C-terminal domain-containing protein n=1 Tax=Aquimarina addita TaxID=870485 RepID=A0ABP7XDW3_9FLAO